MRQPLPIIALRHTILLGFVVISVYPALNEFSVSIRPGNQLQSTDLALLPANWSFHNYVTLFTKQPFLRWLGNSLLLSPISTCWTPIWV